ncbi:MAG: nucleoside deaminase [Nitrospira sp.]|nr:nucleoside deaminase [Nitrospira sp.]
MRIALETAWKGIKLGEAPFGACLVKEGQVVVRVHNVARRSWDITAHAEVQAIREACRMLKTLDLSGTVLYATCEPCPMCFSASIWAKLPRIVYGARIEDAERLGIRQIPIDSARMKQMSRWPVELTADVLRAEGIELLKAWPRTG